MDLLEYQAKELFRDMGIPVLPSQRIDRPSDLKGLKIPYPVVLKSQVRAGGRGKAGGIEFVTTTIDAVAAAHRIFNLSIMGEYPQVLLAEAKYNALQELYLAVVLDRAERRAVLLGSSQGGTSTESAMEKMQRVVVDEDFSPFYARRLTQKMGLRSKVVISVSDIIEKMYRLFVEQDLDLVEINPLGINPSGEVMALDGKVTVNDEAIARHPHLLQLAQKIPPVEADGASQDGAAILTATENEEVSSVSPCQGRSLGAPHFYKLDGNIGIICNGAALTMATLDLVYLCGGKPACFANIGGDTRWDLTPDDFVCRLTQALNMIVADTNVKAVAIDIIGSAIDCNAVAATIAACVRQSGRVLDSPVGAAIAHTPSLTKPLNGWDSRHNGLLNGFGEIGEGPALNFDQGRLENGTPSLFSDNYQPQRNGGISFIVRLCGTDLELAKRSLAPLNIPVVDSLEEAIARAVADANKI